MSTSGVVPGDAQTPLKSKTLYTRKGNFHVANVESLHTSQDF
jgi:hypothetical protein